jgi:ubiquinone/menaquinone biosynthesis C-methylase UbiE
MKLNRKINVKELIKSLSYEDLINSANEYWSLITDQSDQARKPFNNQGNQSIHDLSRLLSVASLYPGMKVLDFGCGSGWLTNILASMGLHASGIDISSNAVNLAKVVHSNYKKYQPDLHADFFVFNCINIPFDDNIFDRIICFDSFHHVGDQYNTLKEFFRVLKPGGVLLMGEPGPNHSLSEAAQYDMLNFNVIENDIDFNTLKRFSSELGFIECKILYSRNSSFWADKDIFNNFLLNFLYYVKSIFLSKKSYNQLIYFKKSGEMNFTSSYSSGNNANIICKTCKVVFHNTAEIEAELIITNTGTTLWLSEDSIAKVNLGVQLLDHSGKYSSKDFLSFPISDNIITAGQTVKLVIKFELSLHTFTNSIIKLNLVSEGISWFPESNLTLKFQ